MRALLQADPVPRCPCVILFHCGRLCFGGALARDHTHGHRRSAHHPSGVEQCQQNSCVAFATRLPHRNGNAAGACRFAGIPSLREQIHSFPPCVLYGVFAGHIGQLRPPRLLSRRTPSSSRMTLRGLSCPDFNFFALAKTRPMSPFAAASFPSQAWRSSVMARFMADLWIRMVRSAQASAPLCKNRSLNASSTLPGAI